MPFSTLGIDFSKTKETLLKLEQACVCSSCHKLPPKRCAVFEIIDCGHVVCNACCTTSLKSCPAMFCDAKITKKATRKDQDLTGRYDKKSS
jgi:hypothetical protein